jgi:hypothetical protein
MSDSPPRHAAEAALVQQLRHAQRLHAERTANPILAGALQRLGRWQARRLALTYADLAAQARYAPAIAFFQNDLYGGEDFARRDSDVARVAPLMVKMLPERVIATIAQAMELNVMSQELDRALLERLPRADGPFSVADYARAYRRAGNVPARRTQIRLIGEIGRSLDAFVRRPLIRTALAMMRAPARMAGFGVLHDFLERGFEAFARMNGAEEFLATIDARETAILEAIVGGSQDPFPEPMDVPQANAAPVDARI